MKQKNISKIKIMVTFFGPYTLLITHKRRFISFECSKRSFCRQKVSFLTSISKVMLPNIGNIWAPCLVFWSFVRYVHACFWHIRAAQSLHQLALYLFFHDPKSDPCRFCAFFQALSNVTGITDWRSDLLWVGRPCFECSERHNALFLAFFAGQLEFFFLGVQIPSHLTHNSHSTQLQGLKQL